MTGEKRYETVLKWFEEYGYTVIKKDTNMWHRTVFKDKEGKRREFEITNNNIWYMKNWRISFGKTKTELYYNLDKLSQTKEENK